MKTQLKKSLKLAVGFQLGWIIIAGIYALNGATIAAGLLVGNLLTLFAPVVFEFITRIKLPMSLQIHFLAFVTASSFMGSILGFYGSVNNWDTYVHIDSGVLIAWFGLFLVLQAEQQSKGQLPKWFAIATAFAFTMASAALWELYEYASDQLIHTNMQIGGLEDTMIDTLAALIGATIAVVLVLLFRRPKTVLPKSLR